MLLARIGEQELDAEFNFHHSGDESLVIDNIGIRHTLHANNIRPVDLDFRSKELEEDKKGEPPLRRLLRTY